MQGIKDKVVVITVPSSGIGDCGHARPTRRKSGTRRARLDRFEALARCMAGAGGAVAYAPATSFGRPTLT